MTPLPWRRAGRRTHDSVGFMGRCFSVGCTLIDDFTSEEEEVGVEDEEELLMAEKVVLMEDHHLLLHQRTFIIHPACLAGDLWETCQQSTNLIVLMETSPSCWLFLLHERDLRGLRKLFKP